MTFFITGKRRGLGYSLSLLYDTVSTLEECDVFINCKHDGFKQVDLLYKAAKLNKKIINIGSAASDWTKGYKENFRYGIEKKTLRDVNDQLFWQGADTTIINFGFFDSERVAHIDKPKMSIEYCVSIIDWVLQQPHRIKDLTVVP
jgi:hypothetical protein|tara:strand:- start:14 stop:448 length:435 start_codon:yes stop_codon:yes gene_type:complete